ncbi:MAG: non-homologous end-joining DNA ligase [Hyphomicrobium zavarzinii]|uniref:non-homologous end-joining DNA ligase n=1 Tax=Hyphomicrobium zavarzinii TaxID=48292 RepID=UPI001A5E0CC2|nr:non-homologous end-joining DNA ligase [Hyphomicrobium zavarzinii]MBL8844221.1 non-homologous end-joining DNA ligase [Hyphomicrobium zavarzinii]
MSKSSLQTPERKGARRGKTTRTRGGDALPAFVAPCLATLTDAPPAGELWLHEIKLDGYRLQARITGGKTQLLTRSGLDWTARFSSLAKSLSEVPVQSALIEGEAVVLTEKGVSSFSALVQALEQGRSGDITFVAFDLLYLDGVDMRRAPLIERKDLLKAVLERAADPERLRFSAHISGSGVAVLKNACKLGLEGIVSKRADLPYRSGRNGDWLKSKCIQTDEFVIGGYVVSSVDATAIGALVLGTFEAGRFVYAGRVGTGFSHETARALWKRLQPLKRKTSAFGDSLTAAQRRGVVWAGPKLVAQIDYRAWTRDGLLRHASFKGLREDKPAAEVARPAVKH